MNTTLNQNRSFNLFIVVGLAIALAVLLTFAMAPSIILRQPAAIPVTGNQNAYVDFLRGEKQIFASPVEVDNARSTYILGEKTFHINMVDVGDTYSVWSLGEKTIVEYDAVEVALSAWRQGEKEIK